MTKSRVPQAELPRSGARIVVIDDSPDDRTLEARLLRQSDPNFEIIEVADAQGWATVLELGAFDLVVTDLNLNWSDGLTIAREVHVRWPQRPIVVVTGTGTEELAVEAMKAGVEDYVLKHRDRILRLPKVVNGALMRAAGRELDRGARSRLDHDIAIQASVSASIGRIQLGDTPEDTAQKICAEIRATLGLGFVAITWFLGSDTMVLAIEAIGPKPIEPLDILPPARSAYLRERSGHGPWIEDGLIQLQEDPDARYRRDAGPERPAINSSSFFGAYAPLVRAGQTVGLIIAASEGSWSIEEVADRLPLLMEYATLAVALVAPGMIDRSDAAAMASDVRAIVVARAFTIVFQPIVGLASKVVAGYEALTRFDDGIAPAIHFARAQRAGVGVELEIAALEAAVEASRILPPWAFVSLNTSSETVLKAGPFFSGLRALGRPVVLELTEHESDLDSSSLVEVFSGLGDSVRLAIDDAGSGYAGLQRVLELRPQFVKLDIELVRNVDTDAAREGLIAGLVHFARATDAALIAEGIEREGERVVLRRLGVSFGQGFLLGRPGPATTWAAGQPASE